MKASWQPPSGSSQHPFRGRLRSCQAYVGRGARPRPVESTPTGLLFPPRDGQR